MAPPIAISRRDVLQGGALFAATSMLAIHSFPARADESAVKETAMTQAEIDKTLQTIADSFRVWPRAPIMHWPDEAGLAYENVTFPS